MSVDLGAAASVHQQVILKLGLARATDTGVVMPMAWRATGWRSRETARSTASSEAQTGARLRLSGTYTVPLGVIGRVGHELVGWRLARHSLEGLVAWFAERIEGEATRGPDSVRGQPALIPAAYPAWERSEMCIG